MHTLRVFFNTIGGLPVVAALRFGSSGGSLVPVDVEYRVYVGAYTGPDFGARGIRRCFADSAGRLRCTDHVAIATDPSFLALSPDAATLYAVSESMQGRVVAFHAAADGTLREINSQPTMGAAPCHLSVHPSGKFLLTAHYVSGDLAVHPIDAGGVLREACHQVQHSGSGPHPRQDGPHAHQIVPDPSGRRVLAVDLGTDSVYVYDFDLESGHLSLHEQVTLQAGSGPRHIAFAPSGTRAYLLSELASTITELDYDPRTGKLEPGSTLSMLPAGAPEANLGAEVVVSRDGRFVFGSNRGDDSIAAFATGRDGAAFERIGVRSAGVAEPRHIGLSPDGGVLFAAGQNSGTIRAFAIGESGELTPVSEPVESPAPVCVLPAPA